MATIENELHVKHNLGDMLADLRRIKREDDFTLVALEGIQAIQRYQKKFAPKGKQGSIPRSIKPARVSKRGHTWTGVSRTTHPPAIFTNEGTGIHKPGGGERYPITQERTYKSGPLKGQPYEVNILHPGIRGTHWWDRGFGVGSQLAIESFVRKVERVLRLKGMR